MGKWITIRIRIRNGNGEMNRLISTIVAGVCLASVGFSQSEMLTVGETEFVYRVPKSYGINSQIMVLFGGRNWPGDKTLKTYNFADLADRHGLFLLSPSFHDRDYWEPEAWSGNALSNAVRQLEVKFSLNPSKLYFYGYSAGGQCANLFCAYMPGRVAAWGAHACGVYPFSVTNASAPAFITCGLKDEGRIPISRQFIYHYRESGGQMLWKTYPGGHELNPEALELARAWFDAVMNGSETVGMGEDDTLRTVPLSEAEKIDIEFRNYFPTHEIMEMWLQ